MSNLLNEIQSLSPSERWEILQALSEKEKIFIKSGTEVGNYIHPYQKAVCPDCLNDMRIITYSNCASYPPPPSRYTCDCVASSTSSAQGCASAPPARKPANGCACAKPPSAQGCPAEKPPKNEFPKVYGNPIYLTDEDLKKWTCEFPEVYGNPKYFATEDIYKLFES